MSQKFVSRMKTVSPRVNINHQQDSIKVIDSALINTIRQSQKMEQGRPKVLHKNFDSLHDVMKKKPAKTGKQSYQSSFSNAMYFGDVITPKQITEQFKHFNLRTGVGGRSVFL